MSQFRALAVWLTVASMALMAADTPKKPETTNLLRKLTPDEKARLDRKAKVGVKRRFDQPDLAMRHYINSRTGPVVTRGANITTSRPLNTALYLPALQKMRTMPRFSAATNTILPADGGASLGPAAPGAALSGWSQLGPANQGGRTRGLLIDPGNANIMYAGGVDGGVWKSVDGGGNWTTNTDLAMTNLAVTTLAFQPNNTNVIYAGTGEGFFNIDAIRGAGIFKSTDGGGTWNQLASTNNSNFHYTNKVVVSPRNPQRVYAATQTGLYRSLDGGATFTLVLNAAAVNGCLDLALQVNRTIGYIFASCGTFAQATVYRALDNNTSTFSSVLSLPGQGRSTLAIAPSNESILYVLAAQATNGPGAGANGLHGVYRSVANGNPGSFTTQRAGNVAPVTLGDRISQLLLSNPVFGLAECGLGAQLFNQGWYDNVIAVDPLDSNRVWVGGIDLWRSDNGGADWGAASYWWFDKTNARYSHADQHGIVFHPGFNGTTNKIMFAASDGGISRIDDSRAPVNNTAASICGTPVAGSGTWTDRNNNYITTQFYDGSVYPNGNTYFGGLQDNGTQRGVSPSLNWSILTGGDGGYTAVDTLGDANNANDVLFAEFTGLSIQKSTNGGTTFADSFAGIGGDNGFQFITPFTMNQGFKQQMWIGGWFIWRTTNQAASWTGASAITCGNGSVSAIAAHPANGDRVLVGMSDGCYHYNHAALSGTSATNWPGNSFIASGTISWIAWHPTDQNIAYLTVSNFGVNNLLKTTNGGVTWLPSVGTGLTALPQIPARTVVVNPADPNQVFVGTDLGVFTSVDAGATWYRENTTFANVSVNALKINETAPYRLFAFTHGRGAWVTALADNN